MMTLKSLAFTTEASGWYCCVGEIYTADKQQHDSTCRCCVILYAKMINVIQNCFHSLFDANIMRILHAF